MPILLASIFSLALGCTAVLAEPNLPATLDRARAMVADPRSDSAACLATATELAEAVAAYPASSLAAEAVDIALHLNLRWGDRLAAQTCADLIVRQYPLSEFAEPAFDVVWNYLTAHGESPGTGAEVAKQFALSLQSDARSPRYFMLAFQGFAADGRWKDAAEMGEQFLGSAAGAAADPMVYLSMSEVALRLGNTALARQSLEAFTSRFGELPQMVIALTQLGHLHTALGNPEIARTHYGRAWSLYQKNQQRSQFAVAEISHAAAEALWILQAERRTAFDEAVVPGPGFKEPAVRRTANSLIDSYTEIVNTDAEFDFRAFSAMADVCAALATALADESFRKLVMSPGETPRLDPLAAASAQANRAAAYYQAATERVMLHEHDPDRQRDLHAAARYVGERRFEIANAQAQWTYRYANLLADNAPTEKLGNPHDLSRLNYFIDVVLPVATRGLEQKQVALSIVGPADHNSLTAATAATADEPLRELVTKLSSLCMTQWKQTATAATQLSSSVRFGLRTSSSSGLVDGLDANWNRSEQYAARAVKAVRETYDVARKSNLSPESLPHWNSLMISLLGEYVALSAAAQSALQEAVAALPPDPDNPLAPLRAQLGRLAADCGSAEYSTLVAWNDLVTYQNIDDPRNREMALRLATLDPQRYGAGADPSASRKHP
ncbi:hypothetical protein HZB60_01785 [candidate division KSB1 bacterium]|nr:hypothetical protein [candidate division KSB1 bacterium]